MAHKECPREPLRQVTVAPALGLQHCAISYDSPWGLGLAFTTLPQMLKAVDPRFEARPRGPQNAACRARARVTGSRGGPRVCLTTRESSPSPTRAASSTRASRRVEDEGRARACVDVHVTEELPTCVVVHNERVTDSPTRPAAPGPPRTHARSEAHLVGKWDVGHFAQGYWPTERGFDSFFGLAQEGYLDYSR